MMQRLRLLLILTATLLLATTETPLDEAPSAEAAFPGGNGEIAFTTPLSKIATIGADGNGLAEVTAGRSPQWSPDGRRIAFTNLGDVLVTDGADITNVTVNYAPFGDLPSWSPDGDKIVFLSSNVLFVVDTDGGNVHQLTPNGLRVVSRASWSPDGSTILFAVMLLEVDISSIGPYGFENIELFSIKPNGDRLTQLTHTPDSAESQPDWMPDGSRYLFTSNERDGGVGTMEVALADGGVVDVVASGNFASAAWSPDGTQIVYVDHAGISVMNANGTSPHFVTAGSGPDWQPGAAISVEFTQGIQQLQSLSALQGDLAGDGEPPVPIIAGKPLAMRLYFADVDEVTDYIVTLSGAASATKHAALEPGCRPVDRRRQENQCSSLNFYFTPPEGQWFVRLKVEPALGGDVIFDEEFHLTSRKTESLVIKAVSICDSPNVVTSCGNANRLQDFVNFMRSTFPTADVRVEVTSNQVVRDRSAFADDWAWWTAVRNDVLNIYTTFDSLASASPDEEVYYFGMVRPGGPGTLLGLASVPGRGGVAKERSSTLGVDDSAQSTTHEIGHLLGVKHTNTGNPAGASFPACYDNAPAATSDWPYADNFLRSGPAPGTVEVGFDVSSQDARPGDEFFELMGYCNPQWLSPRTYIQIMNALSSTLAPAAVAASVDGPFWLVSGLVDDGVASLQSLLEVETVGSTDAGAGSDRIEVRGAGGQVLLTRHFTPVEPDAKIEPGADEGPSTPYFSELIPVQAGATSIVIVDAQSQDIGSIVFGGAEPAVTITLPNTFSGVQTLSWAVNDPDSTTHTYSVLYSTDAGETWSVLGMNLSDASLMIDFGKLPGSAGQALFRVLASDGVNTGSVTSQPFTVTAKVPHAEISGPSGGSFRVGDLVWLRTSAFDEDDGALDGASVTWSSSRDGNLGSGAGLPVYDLSVGQHIITMTARDNDNNTATDTISITVFDGPVVDVRLVADVDCDGGVDALDGLALLLHISGLDSGSCQAIGSGEPIAFGDADCDEVIGPGDVIAVLKLTADLPGGCASTFRRGD